MRTTISAALTTLRTMLDSDQRHNTVDPIHYHVDKAKHDYFVERTRNLISVVRKGSSHVG